MTCSATLASSHVRSTSGLVVSLGAAGAHHVANRVHQVAAEMPFRAAAGVSSGQERLDQGTNGHRSRQREAGRRDLVAMFRAW